MRRVATPDVWIERFDMLSRRYATYRLGDPCVQAMNGLPTIIESLTRQLATFPANC